MEDIPHWVAKYIGLNFESKGRGPDKFDCWGLILLVYSQQFNINLPSYVDKYTSASNEKDVSNLILTDPERLYWISIEKDKEIIGDLILLRMKKEPMHIGIVLGHSSFLHIHTGVGSIIQKYTESMWEKRVMGFYRHTRMYNG